MDLKNVDWPATLKLIVLRLVAAGLIAGVIMFIAKPSGQSLLAIVVGPLAVGIMVGFALICSVLSRLGVPWVGLGAFAGIATVIGDPVLYFASKKYPDFLPVAKFNLINWPVLFIDRS